MSDQTLSVNFVPTDAANYNNPSQNVTINVLNKLNQSDGDFLSAEMVKAFITSAEYRNRFGN